MDYRKTFIKTSVIFFILFLSILVTMVTANSILTPSNQLFTESEIDPNYIPYTITPVNTSILESISISKTGETVFVATEFDNKGNLLVVGYTLAEDLYVKNAFQSSLRGGYDIIIQKYDQEMNLLWSTYFGGSQNEIVLDLVIDPDDNGLFITGWTSSTNLPLLYPISTSNNGQWDVLVAKFDTNGILSFSSYWGTEYGDDGLGLTLDEGNNRVIIVGSSYTTNGDQDGFIFSFDKNTYSLLFNDVFGGLGNDIPWATTVDSSGSITVIGDTSSNNFPVLKAFQDSLSDVLDGFIRKYDSTFTLLFSTYFGGNGIDTLRSIAVINDQGLIISGGTYSDTFNGNFSIIGQVNNESMFFSKITISESIDNVETLIIGGNDIDRVMSTKQIEDGLFFIGRTKSITGLPLTNAIQSKHAGGVFDILLGKLSFDLKQISFLSYYGYEGDDQALDISLTSTQEMVVVGRSTSGQYRSSLTANVDQKNALIDFIGLPFDEDGDGMPYWFEQKYNLNLSFKDSDLDNDNDYLTNFQEYLLGYNPISNLDGLFDNDNDGIPTGWEIKYGFDPLSFNSKYDYDNDSIVNIEEFNNNLDPTINNIYTDEDHDGINSLEEVRKGLNPVVSDSDNDGFSDSLEIGLLGFLGSSGNNQLDNPFTRVIILILLAIFSSLVGMYCYSRIGLYLDNKKMQQYEIDQKTQKLVEELKNDYYELLAQINSINDTLIEIEGSDGDTRQLLKTSTSLMGPITQLNIDYTKINKINMSLALKKELIDIGSYIQDLTNNYNSINFKLSKKGGLVERKGLEETICSKCGVLVPVNSERCFNCHNPIKICTICKKSLQIGQELAVCSHCSHSFHFGHFAETVKIQKRCPVCLTSQNFDDITGFIMTTENI